MERIDRKDTVHAAEPSPKPPAGPTGPPAAQKPRVPMILVWLIVLAVAFMMYRSARPPVTNPSVGKKTGWEWELTDVNGKPADLSDYEGRPVFLNIWATWCPPCVSELPSIARLSRDPKIRKSGVRVLCISVGESREEVAEFMQKRPDNLLGPRFLVANTPPASEFRTEAIPATFLIAPDGTIVESRLGMEDWSRPEMIDRVAALATREGAEEPPPIEPAGVGLEAAR